MDFILTSPRPKNPIGLNKLSNQNPSLMGKRLPTLSFMGSQMCLFVVSISPIINLFLPVLLYGRQRNGKWPIVAS